MALLEVKNLRVWYPIKGGILGRRVGWVKAVDDISFEIEAGATLGLVGESGCGKSSTGKAILGLAGISAGQILFNGEDITKLVKRNRVPYRKSVQMIFQDVNSSLNPRKRVLDIVAEPLRNFEKLSRQEELKRVEELLDIVGLPASATAKYPFEFSGGQRQRVGVARAIALKPKLIIADEPVSALDLSVQAQVLNYLKDIQKELNLAYLFISHDLGVVRHMCEHLAIMHNSRFVEFGTRSDIYDRPRHIYTRRLIAAIPDINPEMREQNNKARAVIAEEYYSKREIYYDEGVRPFELSRLTNTHSVALPASLLQGEG
jgi:peptide/nickel transport system ATP-binding protein